MFPFGRRLGVVAGMAFGLRVLVVLLVVPGLAPAFDPALFHHLGTNLADGLGYVRPPQLNGGVATMPTAEFGPLLPAILGAATWLGGRSSEVHGIVTALLGAATVVVVGLLGRRLAGDLAGLVAAGVVAVHPLLVQVDAVVTAESPYLLSVAVALLAAVHASERPTSWRVAVLGLLLGLGALARADGLALVPLLVGGLAVLRGGPGWRHRLLLAGAGSLAVVAVVGPWTIRNAVRFDQIVPVSNNIGSVVLGANCRSTYEGERLGSWDFGCIAAAAATSPELRVSTRGPNEAEVYGAWRSIGLDYARAHPGALPRVAAARLARTWGVYWDPREELDRNVVEGRHRGLQAAGGILHVAVILPAAAVGAVTLHRRRVRPALVLAVPLLVALTVPALTVGQVRQRTVAEPALAVLAGVAVASRVGRRPRLVPDLRGAGESVRATGAGGPRPTARPGNQDGRRR